jgi:hypothetical protein
MVLSANLNYKTEKLNFFTSTGYDYRGLMRWRCNRFKYFNPDGSVEYIYENRTLKRTRKELRLKQVRMDNYSQYFLD